MSVSLKFEGLDAFRKALRDAPDEVRREADAIVRATADQVAREVRASYPQGPTGNLRRGVTVETNASRFGTSGIVRSRAFHANFFERGTVQRQFKGANRGAMPEPPVSQRAIPKFIVARRRMTQAIVDVLRAHGFEVDTDA